MRNDNHIPVVVTYLGVEILSSLRASVCLFECQYLGIRIQFFCTCNELAYRGILHDNHRFACSTQTAHFHCCGNEGKGFACSNLMGKQQRLLCTSHDGFTLVRTHLELVGSTSEILRHKLVRYAHRHKVVEHIVIDTLNQCRHFRVALHLLPCPILEVLTDFINLGGTSLCRFLVGNGFCCAVIMLLGGGNRDASVLNGGFYESVSHNGATEHFTGYTHGTVLFVVGKVWLFHKPSTAYGSKPDIYLRALFYEILIQFRVNPRTAEGKVNQVCGDFHWHNLLQRLDVTVKFPILVVFFCLTQFLTDISAQILIRCFQLPGYRVLETVTVLNDFFLHIPDTCSKLFGDVRYIHTSEFEDTCNDTVLDIGRGRFFLFFNDTFAEHIGLVKILYPVSFFICRFLELFKSEHIGIVHIIAEKRNGSVFVEVSVCADKIIVCLVEFVKQGLQPIIAFILGLIG